MCSLDFNRDGKEDAIDLMIINEIINQEKKEEDKKEEKKLIKKR